MWPSFDTNHLDPAYPLSYFLIAMALLDRNVDELTEPAPAVASRMHASRIFLLASALFVTPILASLNSSAAGTRSQILSLAASMTICAIVLSRFIIAVRSRESTERTLAHRATHDDLTGLVTRSVLIDRLDHALRRANRGSPSLAVLYVDLDRFKHINDAWGHAVGDLVLVETAARLRAAVRPGDTVARVGGDEFVVACEGVDLLEARSIADRIIEASGSPLRIGELALRMSASVGIALACDGSTTAEQLVQESDAGMYVAKNGGRNCIGVFDVTLREAIRTRRETELALAGALVANQLDVAYQPMIRLGADDIVGFEALARWTRPGVGPVATAEFITLAEEAGLIVPLGDWMIARACERIVASEYGVSGSAPLVSVNISAKQFANGALVRTVEHALATSGADPSRLMFEITESVLVGDIDDALSQLRSINALGVRVAVDDFGTGHSALAYLRRFPIDVVKIDRVFVQQLRDLPPATTLISAVVEIAHALGYLVVAEGVETQEQLDTLRALGCDWAQGFYLSPPLTEAAAAAAIESAARSNVPR
jgi:diguanylate cyclase (GGDEF)-like protein